MDIFQAIILGIVQGITEWLPISSKTHLILVQKLFGISPPVIFDLMLHMGSLLVVLFVFWDDIKELIVGVLSGKKESLMMTLYIIIATIPIAVVGYLFSDTVEKLLNNIFVLGFGLLFTALILVLSRYPKVKDNKLTWYNSLGVGLMQVLALLPGVSRSGMTISTGMMLGIKRENVAKFSFLIFIPAILGATVLEFSDIGQIDNIPALAIGVLVTIVVGYLSLKLLLNIIKKDKFHYFSIYCLLLGILVLLFAFGIF